MEIGESLVFLVMGGMEVDCRAMNSNCAAEESISHI
jgi:hypothetical protein